MSTTTTTYPSKFSEISSIIELSYLAKIRSKSSIIELFFKFTCAFITMVTTCHVVNAQSSDLQIVATSSSEWHNDVKTIVEIRKGYENAVEAKKYDVAQKMVASALERLSLDRARYDLQAALLNARLREMETYLALADKESKHQETLTSEQTRAFRIKQKDVNQCMSDFLNMAIHYRLYCAYTYSVLNTSQGSDVHWSAVKRENQSELQKLWAKRDLQKTIEQSWENLMKESDFLNVPKFPLPIEK